MASSTFCDGVRRRDFIKVGAIGGLGLNLAGYLRLSEAGLVKPTRQHSAIMITLTGGPSHQDTFDLKPNAPSNYRGEFKPIKTNVPGDRDLRTPAEAGSLRRQVHDSSRREPHVRRAQLGHRLSEHRQSSTAVGRFPRLQRGREQRDAGAEGIAHGRGDPAHLGTSRLSGCPICAA